MRKLGLFGGFKVPKFCLDVSNMLTAFDIDIETLPIHSPERKYFVALCTEAWKMEWTPSIAVAGYSIAYQGLNNRFPRNEAEAAAGAKRHREQDQFVANVVRLHEQEIGLPFHLSDECGAMIRRAYDEGYNEYDAVVAVVTTVLKFTATDDRQPMDAAGFAEIVEIVERVMAIVHRGVHGEAGKSDIADTLLEIIDSAEARLAA